MDGSDSPAKHLAASAIGNRNPNVSKSERVNGGAKVCLGNDLTSLANLRFSD